MQARIDLKTGRGLERRAGGQGLPERELQGRTCAKTCRATDRKSELNRWVEDDRFWFFFLLFNILCQPTTFTTTCYSSSLGSFHHLLYSIRQISSIKTSFTIVTRSAIIEAAIEALCKRASNISRFWFYLIVAHLFSTTIHIRVCTSFQAFSHHHPINLSVLFIAERIPHVYIHSNSRH